VSDAPSRLPVRTAPGAVYPQPLGSFGGAKTYHVLSREGHGWQALCGVVVEIGRVETGVLEEEHPVCSKCRRIWKESGR